MTQYLLAVHDIEGQNPYATEEEMQQAFAATGKFNAKLQEQGVWVFGGGLQPADTATVVDARRRRRPRDRRPVRRGQGAARRLLDHHRARPRRRHEVGGRGQRRLPQSRRGAPVPGRASRLIVPAVDTADIERTFRAESGRAVATLVRFFGDIDVAEEAVQDAFVVALERWPTSGLPPSPAGWIITTARNRGIDRIRRESTRDDRQAEATRMLEPDEPAGHRARWRTTSSASSSRAVTPPSPPPPRWR